MAEEMSELERARFDAQTDCAKVTPEQVLRVALDDIRRGDVKPDGCIIILIRKPVGHEDGERDVYRSNLTRLEEIAYLEFSKASALEKWRDS